MAGRKLESGPNFSKRDSQDFVATLFKPFGFSRSAGLAFTSQAGGAGLTRTIIALQTKPELANSLIRLGKICCNRLAMLALLTSRNSSFFEPERHPASIFELRWPKSRVVNAEWIRPFSLARSSVLAKIPPSPSDSLR